MNFQVSAVPDPADPKQSRLLAVEVVRVEEGSRIAHDGRMKSGDQITDINDRPVYQVPFRNSLFLDQRPIRFLPA